MTKRKLNGMSVHDQMDCAMVERLVLDGTNGEVRLSLDNLCRLMKEHHNWPKAKTYSTLQLLVFHGRAATDEKGHVWLTKKVQNEYEV